MPCEHLQNDDAEGRTVNNINNDPTSADTPAFRMQVAARQLQNIRFPEDHPDHQMCSSLEAKVEFPPLSNEASNYDFPKP